MKTDEQALRDFIAEFHADLIDRAAGNDGTEPDHKENVFTELMIEHLADPIGALEEGTVSHFEGWVDRGRAKINGYAVDEDEDTLNLFASIFKDVDHVERVTSDEAKRAVEQATRFFRGALSGIHRTMEPANPAYAMTAHIHAIGGRIERIRVFVMTDGVTGTIKPRPTRTRLGVVELLFEVWDMERLFRALRSGRPHEEIDIDVTELNGEPLACVALPSVTADYTAFVTIVPGRLLYQLYDLYGARILERNVRSFLQAKGKVNKGLRETLKQSPSMFMAYNNGISITAEAVETATLPNGSTGIVRVKGLQIVNGGQTTASIHRAAKIDRTDLSKVHVQAKITVVSVERLDKLAPLIAQYANTQNPIQMADFSANDPFHIEIERLSQQIWIPGEKGQWFYERTRGQYHVALASDAASEARTRQFKERTPKSRVFNKIDLAKFVNAWDQLPHVVSLGGQKNFFFTQRMAEMRSKAWKPDDRFYKELIAKGIIFNEVTRVVRKEGFPGYRSQITAYTVSLLAWHSGDQLDLIYIWMHQRLSAALEALLQQWTYSVSRTIRTSAGSRNVGEWCKKVDCWREVQKIDAALPDPMPPEFQRVVRAGGWGTGPTERRVELDPEDLDAIARCRSIPAADWIRIVEWATSTGYLDARQREIASDLAANAASGWIRELSAKRAREGRRVLNLAMDNDIIRVADDEKPARLERK
jgi:hypothetical protein